MNKNILGGIKILDLSRILAGPFCTQILSDQGAEIIKVESPEGDETRRWGPPFRDGESAYFNGINRNKKSIVLNLKESAAQKALHQLLSRSDVLIENFKVGDLKKFGFSDLMIRRKYPKLIHCQITGYGSRGEFMNYPGYDAAIQAWSGLMGINGTNGPTKVGVPIVDMVTGQNAAFAIMAALYERTSSQLGQKIETSLLENAFSILHPQASNYFFSQKSPKRMGNTHPNIAPYDLFQTKTIGIYIACGNDRQFYALCKALGFAGPFTKFATNQLRVENRSLLEKKLKPLLLKQDARRFARVLLKSGVPAGPALELRDALKQKHVKKLGIVKTLKGQSFVMAPYQFSRSRSARLTAPPRLGSHSKRVLNRLDLTPTEIKNILSQQTTFKRRNK